MVSGTVVVTARGENRIRRGHPWVFRSDVSRDQGITPGALVRVENPRGSPLGFALYSSRSEIRLRVLEQGEVLPDDFLARRIARALAFREEVAPSVDACRLVHGEGDGLPSLVVDRYGDYLVVQTLSQGTERLKGEIVEVLTARLHPKGILERNDPRVRLLEGLHQTVGLLAGDVPEKVEVREGENLFEVDLFRGQKTGLFLDQRENHAAAAAYARGRVFDGFSYLGGFALAAARRAKEVLAVDSSEEATAALSRNASRNRLQNVKAENANVFDRLRELDEAGERFDTVVLDPPAFAKSKGAFENAVRGYKEINRRALRILSPGGWLITCSCSYHVHEDDFEEILVSAAADAGASVRLVEKRRQARDHPILVGVPETGYLKCFVLCRLG